MKKIRRLLLFSLTLSISLTSLKSLSKGNQIKYFIDDYNRLVDDANELFDEYYNPINYYSNNQDYNLKLDNNLKKLNSNNYDYSTDNANPYWIIAIKSIYQDLSTEIKNTFIDINNNTPEFELAFSILNDEDENKKTIIEESKNNIKKEANKINLNIKCLIGAGTASIAFSTISSMVAGINASSCIPFVGWTIALVLVTSLIIYIVANWSYVKEGFNSFIETLKRTYTRIPNLLNKASDQAKEESKNNPDVADDATTTNQMQQEVTKRKSQKK